MNKTNLWVGDTESDGFLENATVIWCAVFKNPYTEEVREFHPGLGENYIEQLLYFLDTTECVVFHNGIGHDWPLLSKLYGYEYKGRRLDSLLMSRLQRPNRQLPFSCPNKGAGPHSIEAWAYRVGHERKIEHEDWSQFSEDMLRRCRRDVEIGAATYLYLIKEQAGQNWEPALKLTHKLFELLHRQEKYGWTVDVPHLDLCIRTLDRWINRVDRCVASYLPMVVEVLETKTNGEMNYVRKPFLKSGKYNQRVLDYFGTEEPPVVGPFSRVRFRCVDLDSNLETKEFLLKLGWEPAEWNTNDEGKRTSPKLSKTDPFDGVQGSLGRLVAKRVQCRQRKSILEGWKEIIRPDGRMGAAVAGLATTGRAKHRGVVNVPRGNLLSKEGRRGYSFFGRWMRQCFIAKEGWVLVGTDSDSNQLRQLAARMQDHEFTDAVCNGSSKAGTDAHSVTSKRLGLGSRAKGKENNYAIIFGAGDEKIGKINGVSKAEGKKFKQLLFEKLPGLKKAIDKLTDEWRSNAEKTFNRKFNRMEYKNGWFTGLDGRPIYCESEHAVLVYALQSDEAIQMAAAYCIFHKWMDKAGFVWGRDYGTVCWYHDEFTVECKPEIADRIARLAEQSIEWAGRYFGIDCPHKGTAQIGRSWADIH